MGAHHTDMVNSNLKRPKYRATNLRAWREYRGLTQETLAERAEVSTATISRLENGNQIYTQPLLERLAEALGCEASDIIVRMPPGSTDYDLWEVIHGMTDEERRRAVNVLKAITDKVA